MTELFSTTAILDKVRLIRAPIPPKKKNPQINTLAWTNTAKGSPALAFWSLGLTQGALGPPQGAAIRDDMVKLDSKQARNSRNGFVH